MARIGCELGVPRRNMRLTFRWRSETEVPRPSSLPLPRLQAAHHPFTLMHATGLALQPGLVVLDHVACQKFAAERAVLRIGGCDRRDRAARAGARVFPRRARILATIDEHVGRRRTCIGEVRVRRELVVARNQLADPSPADRIFSLLLPSNEPSSIAAAPRPTAPWQRRAHRTRPRATRDVGAAGSLPYIGCSCVAARNVDTRYPHVRDGRD